METPIIDFHPALAQGTDARCAIESLPANRIDPKFLYATPRQSELWRQVFLRHAPLQANPEFGRIYREAFALAAARFPPGKVALVGLGCGTGLKELELYLRLKACGRDVLFLGLDFSRDLVAEAAAKLVAAGADHRRSLVCDLADSDYVANWLARVARDLPRVITFFGLVPNLAPSVFVQLFRAVLRPGDVLLASAQLAPTAEDTSLPEAMRKVLPQYDNPETLTWLRAALEELGLEQLVGAPQMEIGEVEGMPAFLGLARWRSGAPFEKWGHSFSPAIDKPLRLFYSLRYTPALFEAQLLRAGFQMEILAITSCREEAIWAVRLTAPP